MKMLPKDIDFLILGSGVSGLYLAYLLADLGSVLVVTKEHAFESNTYYAQGGIASVLKSSDSFKSHIADTLNAGAGLCDPAAVKILVTQGPGHIQRLLDLGADFAQETSGTLKLRREGGHSQQRIVHSTDFTGREVMQVLLEAVCQKGIPILEHHSAVELITHYHRNDCQDPDDQPPACFGAYIYDRMSWKIFGLQARTTILATGGAGQVYLHTTNPPLATGDGIAMAYRAGAEIANMEFCQFHPTALYDPGKRQVFLLTETLRGCGAVLRTQAGKTFLEAYDPRQELAPRDIVARAIDTELKRSGARHLWLDTTHLSKKKLKENFPNIYSRLMKDGIAMEKDWIPIVPAMHYMCGGVRTDLWGRTNIDGLYAMGEAACSGVHGANRLASNSLLEGLVFSARIAENLKQEAMHRPKKRLDIRPWQKEGLSEPKEWIMVQHDIEEIQKIMWNYVGILRSDLRLQRARTRIALLQTEIEDYYRCIIVQNKILELRNLALVAHLIVESALRRKESRGLHYNSDYPIVNTPSRNDTILRRQRL